MCALTFHLDVCSLESYCYELIYDFTYLRGNYSDLEVVAFIPFKSPSASMNLTKFLIR